MSHPATGCIRKRLVEQKVGVCKTKSTSLITHAGFLTEGGPGENPMSFWSAKSAMPAPLGVPPSAEWNWHCGSVKPPHLVPPETISSVLIFLSDNSNPVGLFRDLRFFLPPLANRFGTWTNSPPHAQTAMFTMQSQVMAHETMRFVEHSSVVLFRWTFVAERCLMPIRETSIANRQA